MNKTKNQGRMTGFILGAACAGALGCAVITAAPGRAALSDEDSTIVQSDDIDSSINALAPNCRMIATRRLRWRLNNGEHAALTTSDLEHVVGPLRRGGAAMCDEAIGQRFALGGS